MFSTEQPHSPAASTEFDSLYCCTLKSLFPIRSVNIDSHEMVTLKITLLRLDGHEVHTSAFAKKDIIPFDIRMDSTEL